MTCHRIFIVPLKGDNYKKLMTASSSPKSSNWRSFAERLTSLSQSEGQPYFLSEAFLLLNDLITVDSCAVFKVAADKTTGAQHLCTFGLLKDDLAALLAEDYVKHGFKNDPMVQTALLSPNARVRRLPNTHYSSLYRSQYFQKAKLIDKVSSIHASKNVLFLINFYRLETTGSFDTKEFEDLQRLAPIIGRFVLRHMRLAQDPPLGRHQLSQKIDQIMDDNTQAFSRLSTRERDVCRHSLLGKEEKDIAEIMQVSKSTVITHRRRIYAKLNIGSKTELFQIALMCL